MSDKITEAKLILNNIKKQLKIQVDDQEEATEMGR
jgi:hypothetical protein